MRAKSGFKTSAAHGLIPLAVRAEYSAWMALEQCVFTLPSEATHGRGGFRNIELLPNNAEKEGFSSTCGEFFLSLLQFLGHFGCEKNSAQHFHPSNSRFLKLLDV
jgi:hypothetical protein